MTQLAAQIMYCVSRVKGPTVACMRPMGSCARRHQADSNIPRQTLDSWKNIKGQAISISVTVGFLSDSFTMTNAALSKIMDSADQNEVHHAHRSNPQSFVEANYTMPDNAPDLGGSAGIRESSIDGRSRSEIIDLTAESVSHTQRNK